MKVYLDNSSTSYPKPKSVQSAMDGWFHRDFGNANRSNGKSTFEIERLIFETRLRIARFFNFDFPDHVVFTKSVTESMNLFLLGFLNHGDHVLVTELEHNAILRPLEHLKIKRNISYDIMPISENGTFDFVKAKKLITSQTKLVIANHASNVSGDIIDITAIGDFAKKNKLRFLVDAAQSAGILPLDMKQSKIDILGFTGHKGLMGPTGIGGFLISPELVLEVEPLIFGGTGSYSDLLSIPKSMPDIFEAGTLNTLGIIGLNEGILTVESVGIDRILEHEQQLITTLQNAFKEDSRVRIIGNPNPMKRVGILSLDFLTCDNSLIAHELSKTYEISTRVGLHCAPFTHRAYGTFPKGTVRFSTSFLNTYEEIYYTIDAIKRTISNS